MRICFDRLCFATKRPATTDDDTTSDLQEVITHHPHQPITYENFTFTDSTSTTKHNNNNTNNTENKLIFSQSKSNPLTKFDGSSINTLDPPLQEKDTSGSVRNSKSTSSAAEAVLKILTSTSTTENSSAPSADIEKSTDQSEITLTDLKSGLLNNDDKNSSNTKLNCNNNNNNNEVRNLHATDVNSEIITDKTETSSKMQQNSNIHYQPDLVLVNNNNDLPAGTDILTQSLMFSTVPLNTSSQNHNNYDPNLHTLNLLQQQELQLHQRYQQLQQQAQTQGLFSTTPPTQTPPLISPLNEYSAKTYTQLPCSLPSHMLVGQMQGLCLNSEPNMNSSILMPPINAPPPFVPSTPQEQQFLQLMQAKDLKIQELQHALQYKENEIAELKSHLDKFQSVFPFSRSCSGGAASPAGVSIGGASRKIGHVLPRQRAQGISAEPQSESSVMELLHATFPKYDKEER